MSSSSSSSSRRNGGGDSHPSILIPTIFSENDMRQIPCNTTRNGAPLPTPYDCRYRNNEYLDRHREYAKYGKNINSTNDPSRLTSVTGQDSESVGYYDRYDRLIQHEHVLSTTSEYPAIGLDGGENLIDDVFRWQNRTITNEDRLCPNESTDCGNE